jgi:hypothetical protein
LQQSLAIASVSKAVTTQMKLNENVANDDDDDDGVDGEKEAVKKKKQDEMLMHEPIVSEEREEQDEDKDEMNATKVLKDTDDEVGHFFILNAINPKLIY